MQNGAAPGQVGLRLDVCRQWPAPVAGGRERFLGWTDQSPGRDDSRVCSLPHPSAGWQRAGPITRRSPVQIGPPHPSQKDNYLSLSAVAFGLHALHHHPLVLRDQLADELHVPREHLLADPVLVLALEPGQPERGKVGQDGAPHVGAEVRENGVDAEDCCGQLLVELALG